MKIEFLADVYPWVRGEVRQLVPERATEQDGKTLAFFIEKESRTTPYRVSTVEVDCWIEDGSAIKI